MQKTELDAIIARCKFPGYQFEVVLEEGSQNLYITYLEPDVFKGIVETQRSRPWPLNFATESIQVVQTVFKALLTSMEHRVRENFTVDGKAVLNPHYNLDTLLKIAEAREHAAAPITFEDVSVGTRDFRGRF